MMSLPEPASAVSDPTPGRRPLTRGPRFSRGALLEEEIDEPVPAIRSTWGRKILRLDDLGLEHGMTTKRVSVDVGMNDEPYAEKVLGQLETNGLVELVSGASPKRWRLTRDQRRNRILRVSRLVPEGRWTTYGDIAIAVSGNIRLARPVSRVLVDGKAPAELRIHHEELSALLESSEVAEDGAAGA